MLLLHLMSFLFPQKIRAIYVDHQLQSMSSAWGEFVLNACQQLQVPCGIVPVHVAEGNLENQARNARYQAFEEHLKDNEVLVLAHHQQDQSRNRPAGKTRLRPRHAARDEAAPSWEVAPRHLA